MSQKAESRSQEAAASADKYHVAASPQPKENEGGEGTGTSPAEADRYHVGAAKFGEESEGQGKTGEQGEGEKNESPTIGCQRKHPWSSPVCTRADGSTYNQKTGKELSPPSKQPAAGSTTGSGESEGGASQQEPAPVCKKAHMWSRSKTCTRADGSTYDEKTGKELSPPTNQGQGAGGQGAAGSGGSEEDASQQEPAAVCKKAHVWSRSKTCTRADGSTYDEKTGKELSPPTNQGQGAGGQGAAGGGEMEPGTVCKKAHVWSRSKTCTRADGSTYDQNTGKELSPPTNQGQGSGEMEPGTVCKKAHIWSRSKTCTRADGSTYDQNTGKELSGPTNQNGQADENGCVQMKKAHIWSRSKDLCVHSDGSITNLKTGEEVRGAAGDQQNCVKKHFWSKKVCDQEGQGDDGQQGQGDMGGGQGYGGGGDDDSGGTGSGQGYGDDDSSGAGDDDDSGAGDDDDSGGAGDDDDDSDGAAGDDDDQGYGDQDDGSQRYDDKQDYQDQGYDNQQGYDDGQRYGDQDDGSQPYDDQQSFQSESDQGMLSQEDGPLPTDPEPVPEKVRQEEWLVPKPHKVLSKTDSFWETHKGDKDVNVTSMLGGEEGLNAQVSSGTWAKDTTLNTDAIQSAGNTGYAQQRLSSPATQISHYAGNEEPFITQQDLEP